jgi:GNAT superfamily N-acetyltransferase
VLTVRGLAAGDMAAVTAIVAGLPDYFTSDVPSRVEQDAAAHGGWVLADGDEVAAFAITARRPPAAEIAWIAVDRSRRGRGLGTVLLDHVLDGLAADGFSVVMVKTLDRSAGYPPYEATRGFWENRGFVYVDTIDPLPGWQPGNPAAIYIAALRATRQPAPGGRASPDRQRANNGGGVRAEG